VSGMKRTPPRPVYRRLVLGILPTLVVAQLALADAPPPVRLDREPFDALSRDGKIAFVLSALDARERDVGNFKYQLRETCTNVEVHGRYRVFMQNAEYEMRRLGSTTWMHLVKHESGKKDKDDDNIETDQIVSWDGKTRIHFATPQNVGQWEYTAFIDTREDNEFLNPRFNTLLGLRIQDMETPNSCVPLAGFVRSAVKRGDSITVARDSRDSGALQIKVEIRREEVRWTFWLDPEHGNMISRQEQRYEHGQAYNASHEEVLVPVLANGVWVPKQAVHVAGTSASQEESEYKYVATSFEIGTVKPADVAIAFPVGTMVSDAVNKVAYEVLPEGKKKLLVVQDPKTRTFRTPPADPVTTLPPEEAAKLYKTVAAEIGNPPPTAPPDAKSPAPAR
jgi:hypothetical protein